VPDCPHRVLISGHISIIIISRVGTILITGAGGIIGSILMASLASEHSVLGIDLPEDLALATTGSLTVQMQGVNTVIHLARERVQTGTPRLADAINPKNVAIDSNVFTAVVGAGVGRLILASSVHADDFRGPHVEVPLRTPGSYHPATPYGAYKLISEELGGVLAQRFGFEFIAIRFGGVSRDDSVKRGEGRAATWLSHHDLRCAIAACLAADPVPGRATVFYAVSDNLDRVHDTSNPFGWTPECNSADYV
jgi:nucleoside-diphosphate-sugar epimerase